MKPMKKFLKTAWAVLLYLWQLPQNLLGLAYLAFCFDRVKITEQRGAVFYATKHVRGGMTLGRYVFIAPGNIDREPSTTMSSATSGSRGAGAGYGCLYSAIPSGLHNLFCRAANYYHFYTERSANRLGGVPNYAGEYHYHMDGLIVTYWDKLVALKNKYFK